MQQGDRMQLNRLKMAIQYRQKKVSQEWKSLKCASIINFVLSSMTHDNITLFIKGWESPSNVSCVQSLVCMHCVSVWMFGFIRWIVSLSGCLVLSDESKWEIICRDTLVPELTLCKKISRYLQMQIANRNLLTLTFHFCWNLMWRVVSILNYM